MGFLTCSTAAVAPPPDWLSRPRQNRKKETQEESMDVATAGAAGESTEREREKVHGAH